MRRRNFITGLMVALAIPLHVKASTSHGITLIDRWILRQQDEETLAEWACILNGWGWPKLLPNPEPPTYVANDRRGQIMCWIHGRIGHEAVSWKHNQSVMSKEQFDLWRKHGNKSEVYKSRYPFRAERFQEDVNKRWEHKKAMFARHGAEHLEYIES